MRSRILPFAALALLVLALPLPAGARGGLDEGLLDPAWFGKELEFRAVQEIDYLWVKPGFSTAGKTLRLAKWQDPELLGEKRDSKDSAEAQELTEMMPSRFKGALASTTKAVSEGGDLVLSGQLVDCNAGSKAAKWIVGLGAGSASATWNLKITDAKSGELLVAIHHRAISGTAMSEIEDKVVKWLDEAFVPAYRGSFAIWSEGKKPKK